MVGGSSPSPPTTTHARNDPSRHRAGGVIDSLLTLCSHGFGVRLGEPARVSWRRARGAGRAGSRLAAKGRLLDYPYRPRPEGIGLEPLVGPVWPCRPLR